ncbi:ABC transporter permease, partial [Streptomyces goshikiensis]
MRWLRRNLVVIAGLGTLAYMILPNLVVTVFSFNNPTGRVKYAGPVVSRDPGKDPCGVADMCGSRALSRPLGPW